MKYDEQLEIANLLLTGELNFLLSKGYQLAPDDSVLPFLVQRGFHPKLGARPMRDTIEKLIGDAIATDLLCNGNGNGSLTADHSANCLVIAQS